MRIIKGIIIIIFIVIVGNRLGAEMFFVTDQEAKDIIHAVSNLTFSYDEVRNVLGEIDGKSDQAKQFLPKGAEVKDVFVTEYTVTIDYQLETYDVSVTYSEDQVIGVSVREGWDPVIYSYTTEDDTVDIMCLYDK